MVNENFNVMLFPVNEKDVINKLYTACRTCYSAEEPSFIYHMERYSTDKHTREDKLKLLDYVIRSGHHSVLEHCQLTFFIDGITRATSHQWVRHRHASISQQSQRYVQFKDGKFNYDIPATIANSSVQGMFEGAMLHLGSIYQQLVDAGIPAEDARAVLPNACLTNMTWSCNLRELIHICNERLCSCAQLEARTLARHIKEEVVNQLPFMEDYLVPKCELLGYCNEPRRACGRKPLKKEVIN